MAKCALEHLENDHRNATDFAQYARFLADYVNGVSNRARPASAKKSMLEIERISELIGPYRISTNHEICNLDSDLLRDQLPCAFSGVAVAKEKGHIIGQSRNSILDTKTATTKQSEATWRKNKLFLSSLPSVQSSAQFKEIFVVRNPLSRAVSVYYFWGELFKLNHVIKHGGRRTDGRNRQSRFLLEVGNPNNVYNAQLEDEESLYQQLEDSNEVNSWGVLRRRLEIRFRLGQDSVDTGMVKGPLFTYHGNESTVPPKEIAMAFANRLPYIAGMPGPSYTWSTFAKDKEDAEAVIMSDRIMTIVTERLDESLVVARHYLNWSLADVVVSKVRKALSAHPKPSDWPKEAVDTLTRKLKDSGEISIYEAASKKLDQRISSLSEKGINVTIEVALLQEIRSRVSTTCLRDEYLEQYRAFIEQQGFFQHSSENKLRDAEDIYTEQGHAFGYNRDILYSFDVCGNCEAHAIVFDLFRIQDTSSADAGLRMPGSPAPNVATAKLLKELRHQHGDAIDSLPQFKKCP